MTSAAPARMSGASTGAPESACALDQRGVVLHRDAHVGAHAREFVDVREARVEDRLFDDARPRDRAQKGEHLRLQVGREAGIRRGDDVGAAGDRRRPARESSRRRSSSSTPHSASLSISASRWSGRQRVTRHVAARHRAGEQQRAGDDAVGDDLVLDAVQLAHALDDDRVGAVTGDLRAHRDEEVREVDDLGLHRDVARASSSLRRAPRRASRSSSRRRSACETRSSAPRSRACATRRSNSRARRNVAAERAKACSCMSVARVPRMQPPGSGTSARPKRPSSGPTRSNDAASLRTSA